MALTGAGCGGRSRASDDTSRGRRRPARSPAPERGAVSRSPVAAACVGCGGGSRRSRRRRGGYRRCRARSSSCRCRRRCARGCGARAERPRMRRPRRGPGAVASPHGRACLRRRDEAKPVAGGVREPRRSRRRTSARRRPAPAQAGPRAPVGVSCYRTGRVLHANTTPTGAFAPRPARRAEPSIRLRARGRAQRTGAPRNHRGIAHISASERRPSSASWATTAA
jgi:hypothetical protein